MHSIEDSSGRQFSNKHPYVLQDVMLKIILNHFDHCTDRFVLQYSIITDCYCSVVAMDNKNVWFWNCRHDRGQASLVTFVLVYSLKGICTLREIFWTFPKICMCDCLSHCAFSNSRT